MAGEQSSWLAKVLGLKGLARRCATFFYVLTQLELSVVALWIGCEGGRPGTDSPETRSQRDFPP